uniref:Uncharacterized protein n=1 Tax=Knipowitschia caucasica TaxID=637954 RepID=A0AAV2L721_KNICA
MAEQRRARTAGATGNRDHITSSTLHTHSHTTDVKRYRPGESGFTNNQRLVLGYQPSLDLVDNPQYGSLLFDNYNTETKCQYQPYAHHDGSGFSFNDKNKQSGFYQLNGPQKPQSRYQTTEFQAVYVEHPLAPTVPQSVVDHGKHSGSGFTKGEDLQINTFMSKTCPPIEPRYTHSSIMRTDFQRPRLQRPEVIPNLSSHSSRDTGYSRGPALGKSELPAAFSTPDSSPRTPEDDGEKGAIRVSPQCPERQDLSSFSIAQLALSHTL